MPNDGYGTKVERLAHDDHLTTRQSEIVGVGPLTRTRYSTGTAHMGTVGAAARLGSAGRRPAIGGLNSPDVLALLFERRLTLTDWPTRQLPLVVGRQSLVPIGLLSGHLVLRAAALRTSGASMRTRRRIRFRHLGPYR